MHTISVMTEAQPNQPTQPTQPTQPNQKLESWSLTGDTYNLKLGAGSLKLETCNLESAIVFIYIFIFMYIYIYIYMNICVYTHSSMLSQTCSAKHVQ